MTEEHLLGVKTIYDWLKTQNVVLNLQLEKWIVETRQRPDIYFEIKENEQIRKYAIEFQCSPIATKYAERHDLYMLNNINDIWILGKEKYDINKYTKTIEKYDLNDIYLDEIKTKTIERELGDNLLYLFSNKLLKINKFKETYDKQNKIRKTIFNLKIENYILDNINIYDVINKSYSYNKEDTLLNKCKDLSKTYISRLNNEVFMNKYKDNIFIGYEFIQFSMYRNNDIILRKNIENLSEQTFENVRISERRLNEETILIKENLIEICKKLNNQYKILDSNCIFDLSQENMSNEEIDMLYTINFTCCYFERKFKINNKIIKYTLIDTGTTPHRGKRGGIGWTRYYYDRVVSCLEYEDFNIDEIYDFITFNISKSFRKLKYGSENCES